MESDMDPTGLRPHGAVQGARSQVQPSLVETSVPGVSLSPGFGGGMGGLHFDIRPDELVPKNFAISNEEKKKLEDACLKVFTDELTRLTKALMDAFAAADAIAARDPRSNTPYALRTEALGVYEAAMKAPMAAWLANKKALANAGLAVDPPKDASK